MSSHLENLVVSQCQLLGDEQAAKFFHVSPALIRQWVNGSKKPSLAAVERVFNVPQGASEDAAWAGKDIFLCLPMYKTTNPVTLLCLMGIYDRQKFGVLMDYGDAFVIRTRENIAHRFLESGKEEALWIDDDMVVPMGNAQWYRRHTHIPLPDKYAGLHTANRLRSHGKTIVGGLYFGRHPFGRAMYYEAIVDSPEGAIENDWAHEGPRDVLRPTKWTGTGCLWHTRQVLVDIRDCFPNLAPQFPTEPFHFFTNASDGVMTRFNLIEEMVAGATKAVEADQREEATRVLLEVQRIMIEGRNDNSHSAHLMQGEDQTFGIRAKKAGHPSFVDMGLVCGHIGSAVYSYHNTSKLANPRYQHQSKNAAELAVETAPNPPAPGA